MPCVTIRTGFLDANGQEEIITDYLCDWPDCANVAERVMGVAREVQAISVLCREHATELQKRAFRSGTD